MKLAVVVQRYGAEINGGAELHARYVAEHLARHADVDVITTCARDYVTWRNEFEPGIDRVGDISVRRFPVSRERDPYLFAKHSDRVFTRTHSINDELSWLRSEGPTSPALVEYLLAERSAYDYFVVFSYRYYHAYHVARELAARTVLVPTAERDAAIGVSLFKPIFSGVRAVMYNSPEEHAMIRAVSNNDAVPGVVVGVGSEVPDSADGDRFRQKFDISGPFAIYVGRIDENKGCRELFDFFIRYVTNEPTRLSLVLIGAAILPIPDHPRIRHLGFVDDRDKFDGMSASNLLIMPSYYESLSMVAIEAWGLRKPIVVNGKCDVLRGQSVRSNAGLYYENYDEFAATLKALEGNQRLSAAMGQNGFAFYQQNYAWPVVEGKYLDVLDRLSRADREGAPRPQIDPLPPRSAWRRSTLPPAEEVVEALPRGPAIDARSAEIQESRR